MALLTTSCTATGRANNSYCQIAKPILIGKDDNLSDVTARQILEHNRIGKKTVRVVIKLMYYLEPVPAR